MKDKLEVGMYVKFKTLSNQVKLGQIQLIDNSIYELDNNEVTADKYIIKASHNIIDLIEVGDYVNGDKIGYIDDCEGTMREFYYDYENPNEDVGHWQEEIKSITTHEQMEQIAYKLDH